MRQIIDAPLRARLIGGMGILRRLPLCAWLALTLAIAGSGGCGPSGKGLSELCQSGGDCASGVCRNVAGGPDEIHSMCSGSCVTDADCEKIDPRGVCHNQGQCVLGCAKDTDCPQGASCSSHSGGGCYQN